MGINAPESRTRDLEEKAKGLAAKDRVKALLEGCNNIQLHSHCIGKFVRCLGEIFLDTIDGKEKLTLDGDQLGNIDTTLSYLNNDIEMLLKKGASEDDDRIISMRKEIERLNKVKK